MDIKLLAAPVNSPLVWEVNAKSMSLVSVSQRAGTARQITRSDDAYSNDRFIWSAQTRGDGSFHFSALNHSRFDSSSGLMGGSLSAHGTSYDWRTTNADNIAAQYSLYAGMPTTIPWHVLDVYA
jgi:hypothetical protein